MHTTKKPWGEYSNFLSDDNYLVKLLIIRPGEGISLQYHKERCEHWIVLSGEGVLQLQKSKKKDALTKKNVGPNDYIFVEKEYQHRLFVQNYATEPLKVLEVQYSFSGHCNEEDIVRVDDPYNRV